MFVEKFVQNLLVAEENKKLVAKAVKLYCSGCERNHISLVAYIGRENSHKSVTSLRYRNERLYDVWFLCALIIYMMHFFKEKKTEDWKSCRYLQTGIDKKIRT